MGDKEGERKRGKELIKLQSHYLLHHCLSLVSSLTQQSPNLLVTRDQFHRRQFFFF